MKILLLTPIAGLHPVANPPLGLCYIKSSLLRAGFKDTTVVDMSRFNLKTAEKTIREKNPDLVGITCFTDTRFNTFAIAEIDKKINKDTKVVLGGPHATHLFKQILENYPSVDFICLSEGEATAVELARAIESNLPLEGVAGIAFRRNNEIFKTPDRAKIADLDTLPFPNYDDLDLFSYKGGFNFERGKPRASIIGSRGCIYSCIFCYNRKMWGGYRTRSASSILAEIEWLVKGYGFKYIFVIDDFFTSDEKKVVDICNGILDKKLDIQWSIQARADTMTKKLVKSMRDAGCQCIVFGIESGSPSVLKKMNKMQQIDDVVNAFSICNEFKMPAHINLIVGNPGESRETIRESKELLGKIKADLLIVNNLRIYPGTRLSELAKTEGVFNDDLWLTPIGSPYYTGSMKMKEIYKCQWELYLFYFRSRGLKGYLELLRFFWLELWEVPDKLFKGLYYLFLKKDN
jgi:anaerobic magnesium-protoporphyrin IX monomethyl ester cyclase